VELTLVILAAGLSTRYGGLKQLAPLGPAGEALMDYGLHDAVRAGFTRAVFIVRPEIEAAVRQHAERLLGRSVPAAFVHQKLDDVPTGVGALPGRVKPWGTAHAVLAARSEVHGPFAVCNADDFYGAEAYVRLARHLTDSAAIQLHPVALVGYRLEHTLSEAGGVSRAICETDEAGTLTGITELKEITMTSDGIEGRSVSGQPHRLHGSDTVSMNLWGFTPAVFPALARQFDSFVRDAVPNQNAEFLIPTVVAEQVAAGETSVRVLETDSHWMGVTFRDDKDHVAQRIRALVAAGAYPRDLSNWFSSRS
jgi:choline kinase